MTLIKSTVLAKALGVSRFTVRDWCRKQPDMVVKKGRDNYIKLEILMGKPDVDEVELLLLLNDDNAARRYIKLVELARIARLPRRTLAYWCMHRPGFGFRCGRNWFVNLQAIGMTEEQIDDLSKNGV